MATTSKQPSTAVNANQAAARLGVPKNTMKWWRAIGRGPAFIRLSHKTVVYDSDVLDEFLRVHTCQPSVREAMEERHGSLQESR